MIQVPPTCASCVWFRPTTRMLDPLTMQSVQVGDCERPGLLGAVTGFRMGTESCGRHAPRVAPEAPAEEREAA